MNVFSGGSRVTGTSGASLSEDNPFAEPSASAQTVQFTFDPENPCTITIDNNVITIRGKECDLLREVMAGYPEMRTEKARYGDELIFTLTPKTNDFDRKYGMFYIVDANNNANKVHIELTDDGVKFADVSELVENNDIGEEYIYTLTRTSLAKCITIDGSFGKVPQILSEIKKISDDICKGIDSDYEKLRAIVHWTAENIYYDYPAYNMGIPPGCTSLEYMLNNKSSVCGGYATMTSALCAAQGIHCYNVMGLGIPRDQNFMENYPGEFHEWNIAEIDGRRIIVDAGWSSRNTFGMDGKFNALPISYGYFDINPEIFCANHKAQNMEYRDYYSLLEG